MDDALVRVPGYISALKIVVRRIGIVLVDEYLFDCFVLGLYLCRHLDLLFHVESDERHGLQEEQRRDGLAIIDEARVRQHFVSPSRHDSRCPSVSTGTSASGMVRNHMHVDTWRRLDALSYLFNHLR